MSRIATRWVLVVCAVALTLGLGAGCKGPKGATKAQKQADVRAMRDRALGDLYNVEPQARKQVNSSVGYAVFDSMGTNLLMLASARGYGVAIDRQKGTETFMKMFELGGGVGLGVKDFRVIMIFSDRPTFDRFLEYGLEIGGDADLALKSDDDGASVTATESTASLQGKVETYIVNKAGAAVQAVATGTKYSRDEELN